MARHVIFPRDEPKLRGLNLVQHFSNTIRDHVGPGLFIYAFQHSIFSLVGWR